MLFGRVQSLAPIGRRDDLEAGKPQGSGQQFPDVRFVVDDQQFGFGSVLFLDSHVLPVSGSLLNGGCVFGGPGLAPGPPETGRRANTGGPSKAFPCAGDDIRVALS